MAEFTTVECRGCAARMIWTTSPADRALPLDARSLVRLLAEGVITSGADRLTRYSIERRHGKLHAVKDPNGNYVSHWVTCTNRPAPRPRK